MLPIYLLSDKKLFIAIESYTTANELKYAIIRKLNIDKSKIPYLGLYEICDKTEIWQERFLENSERIADVLAQWEYEIRSNKAEKISFKLYLRLRVFPKLRDIHDVDMVALYYTHVRKIF